MPPIQVIPPRPTGLAAPTSTAALGASRALTSHVRNFYLVCYDGKCKRPRLTFFIDMGLLAAAVALFIAVVWIVISPVAPPGVALSFAAPPIQSAAAVPIVATIRTADGVTHRNVRVQWHLPQGAQLLNAHPSFAAGTAAYLGDVSPGRDVSSRALVRFFLPPGQNAEIGFSVFYDDNGIERQYTAHDQRPIVGTALTADVPLEFQNADVTKEGTTLPLRIVNTADQMLPSAYVAFTTDHASSTEVRRELGDLAPHEERLVFVEIHPTSNVVSLQWSVGATARDLAIGSWEASVVDASERLFPVVSKPLRARPGTPIQFSVADAFANDSLLVVHPLLDSSVRRVQLDTDSSQIELPAPISATGTNHEWFVVPVMTSSVNRPVLGPAVMGVTTIALPFSAQVRYVSSAGDQLGAGPNPPQVGTETRYWVFWTIGPVDNALENITVDADLPRGVSPTGNVSGPDGGSFRINNRHVRWSLSQLTATDSASSRATALFGFEISVTPKTSDIGQSIPLLGESMASAEDTQTTVIFEGIAEPVTSVLPEDVGKENAGIVQSLP